MNTLRSILFGCDADSGESWGYVTESGVEVRLGSKHYAERVCSERNVECIKLDSIQQTSDPIKTVPCLGEDITFKSFLSTSLDVFTEAMKKQLNQRHEKLNAALVSKKSGAHHSDKSDYKRSKEKEKFRKQVNNDE